MRRQRQYIHDRLLTTLKLEYPHKISGLIRNAVDKQQIKCKVHSTILLWTFVNKGFTPPPLFIDEKLLYFEKMSWRPANPLIL